MHLEHRTPMHDVHVETIRHRLHRTTERHLSPRINDRKRTHHRQHNAKEPSTPRTYRTMYLHHRYPVTERHRSTHPVRTLKPPRDYKSVDKPALDNAFVSDVSSSVSSRHPQRRPDSRKHAPLTIRRISTFLYLTAPLPAASNHVVYPRTGRLPLHVHFNTIRQSTLSQRVHISVCDLFDTLRLRIHSIIRSSHPLTLLSPVLVRQDVFTVAHRL